MKKFLILCMVMSFGFADWVMFSPPGAQGVISYMYNNSTGQVFRSIISIDNSNFRRVPYDIDFYNAETNKTTRLSRTTPEQFNKEVKKMIVIFKRKFNKP